ncbi:MAG: hypothetical protein KDD45_11905 [Bdellovibrionales bacterium]|nr:hypothetical protein [Bdellovibrionales bacterium]
MKEKIFIFVLLILVSEGSMAQMPQMMGRRPPASGVINSCPFYPPKSQELNEMFNNLKSELLKLNEACPNVLTPELNKMLDPNSIAPIYLKTLPSDQISAEYGSLPNPAIENVTLTCGNYRSVLGLEFSQASERLQSDESILHEDIPYKYRLCKSSADPAACAKKLFNKKISEAMDSCKETYKIKINNQLQQQIESLATAVANPNFLNGSYCKKILQRIF